MTKTFSHISNLFRTMILVAALGYAISLALPSGAGAATAHVMASPHQVVPLRAVTVRATAMNDTACRLRVISPAGVAAERGFTPVRRTLTWTLRIRASAAAGHWTIATDCDGIGVTSSTEIAVAGHGASQTLAALSAPRQSGPTLTGAAGSAHKTAAPTTQIAVPKITWGIADGFKTRNTSARFDFTGADAYQCQIDVRPYTTCDSGISYTGLNNGAHVFHVRAVSANGQVSRTVGRTWIVDAGYAAFPAASGCTFWAYQKRPDIWDTHVDSNNNWMAWTWIQHARAAGYTVDQTPQQGDIAVWGQNVHQTGETGHVAYVEDVNDNGSITVSETGGIYGSTPHVSTYSTDGLWFIHQHQ